MIELAFPLRHQFAEHVHQVAATAAQATVVQQQDVLLRVVLNATSSLSMSTSPNSFSMTTMRLPWSPFKMWFSSVVLPDLRGEERAGGSGTDRKRKQRHQPGFSSVGEYSTAAVGTACARTHARGKLPQDAPEEASQDRDGHALVLHRFSTGCGAGDVETTRGTRGSNRCTTGHMLAPRGALAAERGGGNTSEAEPQTSSSTYDGASFMQARRRLWRRLAVGSSVRNPTIHEPSERV